MLSLCLTSSVCLNVAYVVFEQLSPSMRSGEFAETALSMKSVTFDAEDSWITFEVIENGELGTHGWSPLLSNRSKKASFQPLLAVSPLGHIYFSLLMFFGKQTSTTDECECSVLLAEYSQKQGLCAKSERIVKGHESESSSDIQTCL